MTKRALGVIFLLVGIGGMAGGILLFFSGLTHMTDTFGAVAQLESPGELKVELENAGKYTVWHDHRLMKSGKTVSNPPHLPTGMTLTLTRDVDGKVFPLTPMRGSTTLSLPDREARGVGTFVVDSSGSHTLAVTATGGENRHFSLTEGEMLSGMAQFGLRAVLACLLGFFGVVFLVLGLVFVLLRPKPKPITGDQQVPPPPPV